MHARGESRAAIARTFAIHPTTYWDGLVDATTHPQIQIYPRGVGRQQGPTP